MLQAQIARPLRSPQQRFATIAVVAALHLGVLLVVLNAFTHTVRLTIPETITHVQVLPPKPTETSTRSRPPDPNLTRPKTVDVVPPPLIPVSRDTDKYEPPVTPNRGQIAGPGTSPSVFVAAEAIASTHTRPPYPPFEQRLGHEGEVLLKLQIDEKGVVTSATVERSSGHEDFDRSAIDWVVANWRYQPATQDGKAIASSKDALVRFQLASRQF